VDKVRAPREEISKVQFYQGKGFTGKDFHNPQMLFRGSFLEGFTLALCNL
jgi:hypothetical protein